MRLTDLFEAPIANMTAIGDFDKSSSFRHADDRAILSREKPVEKIKRQWAKTEHDYNMYFVNTPEAGRFKELGAVSEEWVKENMPKAYPFMHFPEDHIHIIFTNNSGAERYPMTGWIIAHRFGHALFSFASNDATTKFAIKEFADILHNGALDIIGAHYTGLTNRSNSLKSSKGIISRREYGKYADAVDASMLKNFYQNIGTMRSARNGELRSEYEFVYELLAQYLLTGSIKFDTTNKHLKVSRSKYNRPLDDEIAQTEYEYSLESLADTLQHYADNVVGCAVNKIFVM